jgi:hypothetical protein
MARKIGINCKAYINTATTDTWDTPTWTELILVQDVQLELTKNTTEVTIRGALWDLFMGTTKAAAITIGMLYDTGDANFKKFRDAFLNNTQLDLALMDGDITVEGSQGLRAIFDVTKFSAPQPLKEALKTEFDVALTYNNADDGAFAPPTWLEVEA